MVRENSIIELATLALTLANSLMQNHVKSNTVSFAIGDKPNDKPSIFGHNKPAVNLAVKPAKIGQRKAFQEFPNARRNDPRLQARAVEIYGKAINQQIFYQVSK